MSDDAQFKMRGKYLVEDRVEELTGYEAAILAKVGLNVKKLERCVKCEKFWGTDEQFEKHMDVCTGTCLDYGDGYGG